MKWSPLLLAAVAAAGIAVASSASAGPRRLRRGTTYRATYKVPEGSVLSASAVGELAGILPPDSAITLEPTGGPIERVTIEFAAQRDSEIGDLTTPIGVFRLVGVRAL